MTPTPQPYGIEGITDDPRPTIPAKAKIGRISADGLPEKLDHIVFVHPENGQEVRAFRRLGERPTSFLAVLPADDPKSFLDCAWKRYGKAGLKCRGDGRRGIERRTGRERDCAGPYQKDNPAAHRCRYARPRRTRAGGVVRELPPECKPVLSLRLIVPLMGAFGLVQIDTGGAASSIPALYHQLTELARTAEGRLAGLAVKVCVRPFAGRHGTAYAWTLLTPTPHELEVLRRGFAPLTPLRGIEPELLPRPEDLPPLIESIDADIYGLCVAPRGREQSTRAGLEATNTTIRLPEEVRRAEARLEAKATRIALPEHARESLREVIRNNRRVALRTESWPAYVSWLEAKIEELGARTRLP